MDFASASAHKIGSLNNFGFLYAKDGDAEPLLLGGGQENGLRSGTTDLLGILVLNDCLSETLDSIPALRELKHYFISETWEKWSWIWSKRIYREFIAEYIEYLF